MKYRRIVVTRHGGPEVLRLVEEDLPEPGPGEIRLKVLAAGVSAYDAMLRRSGRIPRTPRVPYTPGGDVVGLADGLGEGVTGVAPGQMLGGVTFSHPDGGYAEYICLKADDLVPVPAGADPAEAVCLPINYLTAHVALHLTAGVKPGESILVHGAAGGVGTALLELGRVASLTMYGTASKHNHGLVTSLGAVPIDYRNVDFVEFIRSRTDGGVDAVFDPVGGGRQLRRSYRALRRGGRLVFLGVASSAKEGLRVIPKSLVTQAMLALIPDGRRLPVMKDLTRLVRNNNGLYREIISSFFEMLAVGKLRPVIAERIPLAEAALAHELLERGGYAGKFVLVMPEAQ